MPKLKIIFAVTNDLSYDQRMQRICTSLADIYEVELVGRSLESSKALDNFNFKQTRLKCLFNKGKLFYVEYNIRLFLFLLFRKADIICAIDLDTIACYHAARLKGAKIVYDAHELFPEVPEVARRPQIQKIWQWVERVYIPRMDLVYTVSQSISELFEERYARKVYTIRNLPYLTDNKNSVQESKYLLYQGALNEGRGIEHLIDAMKDIDTTLYLVGEGDLSDQLKKQVQDSGLENKIKFLGFKKPEELKIITAEAYIGLNLLEKKGMSYYYSLANKFSDYIQAEVPQICINFPEYKRINDQYNVALLVDNTEKETIQTAIRRLLGDQELYDQLKENCVRCKSELNWQNEEKKLIAVYGQLR